MFWVPSIAISGVSFYTGDRLAAWKGNAFVGSMMEGRTRATGHVQRITFAENGEAIQREPILGQLRQRIRDVRPGPDGLLYVLTDNCAVELTRLDRGVAAHVGKSLRRIEATFCEAIEAAKARGELRADSDVVGTARFLTAGIQGLRLVGKANHDRATLEDVARVMLRCLDQ